METKHQIREDLAYLSLKDCIRDRESGKDDVLDKRNQINEEIHKNACLLTNYKAQVERLFRQINRCNRKFFRLQMKRAK